MIVYIKILVYINNKLIRCYPLSYYFLDISYSIPYEFIPKKPKYEVKIIIVVCNRYVFKIPIDIKPDLYDDRYIDDLYN
jgi:hypothetical protein